MLEHAYVKKAMFISGLFFIQLVIFSSISLFLSGLWDSKSQEGFTFTTDVSVAGVSLKGKSEEQASQDIARVIQTIQNSPLEITYNNQNYTFDKKELDIHYNIPDTLRQAKMVDQETSGIFGMWKAWRETQPSSIVPLSVSFNQDILRERIERISSAINRSTLPAKLVVKNKTISVIPETSGYKVDVDKTIAEVIEELQNFQNNLHVALVVGKEVPQVNKNVLQGINTFLAEGTVQIPLNTAGAADNIKKAAALVNGTVLLPGEMFSLNKKITPFSQNGYISFPVQLGEQTMSNVSMDVSQVASALYTAAVRGNLAIVERHPFPYLASNVKPGLDSYVDGQEFDLRFINRGRSPVYIYTGMENGQLRIALFGNRQDFHPVSITVKEEETIFPNTVVKPDYTLAAGQEKIIQRGRNGKRVKVTLYHDSVNAPEKYEQLSDDYYKPVPNIIAVGPSKEQADTDQANGNQVNINQQQVNTGKQNNQNVGLVQPSQTQQNIQQAQVDEKQQQANNSTSNSVKKIETNDKAQKK
jgi:vancomycin resistance protein YoaR